MAHFFIVLPSVISLNVVAPEKFYNICFSAAKCFLSLTGQKTEKKFCLKKKNVGDENVGPVEDEIYI